MPITGLWQSLYAAKIDLVFLGHSGQQTSVMCADAIWITKSEGIVHYKSLVIF